MALTQALVDTHFPEFVEKEDADVRVRALKVVRAFEYTWDGHAATAQEGTWLVVDGGDIEHVTDEAFAKLYVEAGPLEIPIEHDEKTASAVISPPVELANPGDIEPADTDPATIIPELGDEEDEDELDPEEDEGLQTPAAEPDPEGAPALEEWPRFEDREDGNVVQAIYAEATPLTFLDPANPGSQVTLARRKWAVWDGEQLEYYADDEFSNIYMPFRSTDLPEGAERGITFPWFVKMLLFMTASRLQEMPINVSGAREFMAPETGDYWHVHHVERDGESFLNVVMEPGLRMREGLQNRRSELGNLKGQLERQLRAQREAMAGFDEPTARARHQQAINEVSAQLRTVTQEYDTIEIKLEDFGGMHERLIPLFDVINERDVFFFPKRGEAS